MANAVIEGFECTLFYDYDCERFHILDQLSDDGKIEWLERRMRMIFLDPLAKIYDRTSIAHHELNFTEGGPPMTPMLMTMSLLMNGIEALGSFLTTATGNKQGFEEFMNRYMPDWTVTITAPYHGTHRLSDILWKFYRNGLAHSFAILRAGIDDVPGTDKYMISDNVLQIDGWKFFPDLQHAFNQMFQDARTDNHIRTVLLGRFNDIYQC